MERKMFEEELSKRKEGIRKVQQDILNMKLYNREMVICFFNCLRLISILWSFIVGLYNVFMKLIQLKFTYS